jgi:hypothetical protein
MNEQTVVGQLQAELAQVRRPGRWLIPHPGGTPPALDAETLATAVHRAGLERMRAHDAPPAVQLARVVPWAERQAAIDAERRRRGDARLDRAQQEALDRRDQEDDR